MEKLINKINELKREKNAVILAHCYQNVEIDEVADFVGDSLYLSRMAKNTNADIIIFAGVSFMAETAKLLSPEKRVFLPRKESGCAMADMITPEALEEFKSEHPNKPVICYINSTAKVKSECDVCCTSSNALNIVKGLGVKEVLFVPDNYLGKWVESQLDGVKVTTFAGCCPIHQRIVPEDMFEARNKYPNAKILAHPECHHTVSELADFVGSTKEIMEFVKNSGEKEFVIATEKGVVDRLTRDYKDKKFYLIKDSIVCESMKYTTLEDIYNSLLNEEHEIFIDKSVAEKATRCIENMFKIGNGEKINLNSISELTLSSRG